MTEAAIGWGTEAFLGTSTDVSTLFELGEVIDVPFPDDQVADVEATHMKSPDKRKEYITGMVDGGTGDVVMNYVQGSPTDVFCRAALAAGDARAFRIKLLEPGGGFWQIDINVIVKGYKRTGPIDNRKTATMTLRFTGASTEAAV